MSSTKFSINHLPDEILLHILSYVGPEELCLNITKVCARWNNLAKDMALWKTLTYNCDRFSDISRITEVLSVAPALHSLIVRRRNEAARILDCLFDNHVELRKLILENCYLGEGGTRLLDSIVSSYPDLEGLSLASCYPLRSPFHFLLSCVKNPEDGSQVTSAGYSLIPRLKKLSELNLSYCKNLCREEVCLIVNSCQHLKKLSLSGAELITDEDIILVIKKLGKQLTKVALNGFLLSDDAYSKLYNFTRLKELEINNCEDMTEVGLLEGIAPLHELTFLRLTQCHNLTAQSLATFLHRHSMSSITLLDLSECTNLDDEGLKGIAKRCKHLKDLAVCECHKITDTGIGMVVRHCSQLRILNLQGVTYITGEGWMTLVPAHLPYLRQLCLMWCNNVCHKYVEELVATLPELEIAK